MPVPKKRTSKAKRNLRRSHHALTPQYGMVCPKCGEATLRHRACGHCGHYRGKEILSVK